MHRPSIRVLVFLALALPWEKPSWWWLRFKDVWSLRCGSGLADRVIKSIAIDQAYSLTMPDDACAERGDDEDSFILDSVFPVSRQSPSHPSSHHAYYIIQEPLRPPSPEPTTAVYERSVAGTIAAGT